MRGEPHATLVRRTSSSPRAGRRRGAVAGDAGRLLVRASAALDRSVRYEDTLKNIVTFAVPRMADYAALALPSDDGSLTWAAATHCNPDKEPLLGRLRGQGWRTGSMERMRAGQPHGRPWLIRHIDDDLLRSMADDEVHLMMLTSLGLTSLIVLPLMAGDSNLGSLLLGTTSESMRVYTERDATIAAAVGRRAAAAVQRALLFRDAERASRAREHVVGLVSHDLRNPLSTIMLAVDFLLEDVVSRDAAHSYEREHIETIGRAARRMDRLVDDLLDVTAIEAGQLRMNPTPITPELIVADAVELLAPLATERNIVLIADVESELPSLPADRERLLQVFSNLGGNAIKFTPEGGQVHVSARAADGSVEFVVRDTGAGIPPDDLPCIFVPFWQQANTHRSSVGLGLAICRAIVEAHGGTIRVASDVGIGTAFTFALPANACDD